VIPVDSLASMEVMTMTQPLVHPDSFRPWTVEELEQMLVDNGMRYELVDGTLVVSPMPAIPHLRITNELHLLLARQAPDDIKVGQNGGVSIDRPRTYLVPDIFVVRASAYDEDDEKELDPGDVLLAVEVLSPSSVSVDRLLKRHYYAKAAISSYWIVDRRARTLTVLCLDGDAYVEEAVVKAGTTWRTNRPFPFSLDLAEVL
jgi:Uma2 family endonuclease